MLNPNWLHTFKTLIDTGHFTKTAAKLFMTQPGVSQHINKLEQACGHSLIRREKKRFELTEQGRQVYLYAEKIITNESDFLESLSFDDPFCGKYTIASSGAVALLLYSKLLNLQRKYSGLIVNYKAAPNHQILTEIQQGLIDIGIVTHIPNPSLFDTEKLAEELLYLVLPASMANIDVIDESLLTTLGLIDHPDAEQYVSLYLSHCQEPQLANLNINKIKISGFVNQIGQILDPVAKGLGFTVLPKSAIDSFPDRNKLKIFKAKQPVIETLFLVKKRSRDFPARFNVISETIQEHFIARQKHL